MADSQASLDNFDASVDFSEPRLPGGKGSTQSISSQMSTVEMNSSSQMASKTSKKEDSKMSKMEEDPSQLSESQSKSILQKTSNLQSQSASNSEMSGTSTNDPNKMMAMDKTQWESTRKICCCEVKDEALRRFWQYCIIVILCGEFYYASGAVIYMWIKMYPIHSSLYFLLATIYATVIIPLLFCDFSIEIRRTWKKKKKNQRWIDNILYSLRVTRICLIVAAVITVYTCCLLHDQDFMAGISHAALQIVVTALGIGFKILEDRHLKKIRSD